MYKYAIRVDKHEGYEEGIKCLEDMSHSCIGVFHTGKSLDNPHWHFIVEIDVKTVAALRARLRKFWSVPKSLSIKPFDGDDKGIRYLFHEKDRDSFSVVSQKGYSEEQVKSFKEESYSKNRKVEKSRRERPPTFTEKLIKACEEEFMSGGLLKTDEHGLPVARREVMKFVLRHFGYNYKVFDKFVIQRAFNLVCFHLYGEDFVEEFTDMCLVV